MGPSMLTDKVALITGATGGVGPAVVQGLAQAGAGIVAVARHADALARLEQEAGVPAERWLAYAADLGDLAGTQAAVQAAQDRFGRVDILAAVAGGWRGGAVVDTAPDTVDWLWRINFVTAFNAIQAVLPGMAARGWGRIVTLAARSALGGQARSGVYAASKAAVLTLTQSVAAENRNRGVTANTLLISTADTPANHSAMPNVDSSHWVSPAQIAATILFLCSDAASAISGAAIPL